jgi:predicted nucleotidyltransferase
MGVRSSRVVGRDEQLNVQATVERVAGRLRSIAGVKGIALGGSRARGVVGAEADVDVGIYYSADARPDVEAVRAAANELDDRGRADGFGAYGEWGPWINGGAWLRVDGYKTDLLFRELDRVERVLEGCEAGRVVCAYQPGHPHCFASHIYLGELHHNVILFDPDGTMARLRQRTDPYPELLAAELMRMFGWEAEFSLATAQSAARRGDVVYVAGCLFRSIACMSQALFAANRTYLLNEKGAVAAVERLEHHPSSFALRAKASLGHTGEDPNGLGHGLRETAALRRETQAILDACAARAQPVSRAAVDPKQ